MSRSLLATPYYRSFATTATIATAEGGRYEEEECMPTADDYRYAALRFEEIAIEVAQSSTAIGGPWDHVATGGRLAQIIETTVGDAQTDLASMVDRLMTVSDECKRRARICDVYAAEIASYRANPRMFDSFPQPPFEWVEVDGRPASDRTRLGGMW